MSQALKTNMPTEAAPLALTASFQIEAAVPGPETGGAPALPKFRMVAYTGGPMRIAGWRYPVVVDLAGLAIPSQNRPIRFGHNASSAGGVGHTDAIRVESGQLIATGVVSRDTAAAKEIVVSSKNGFPWQASIGASVEEFEFIKENQKTSVNGRTFDGPVNVVRKATLGEISFVGLGADGNTSAQVAASSPGTTPVQEKETSIMEGNASANVNPTSTPATPQPTVTSAAPAPAAPVVQAAASNPAASVSGERTPDQVRAEALAETTRIAAIRKLCAPGPGRVHFAEIEAKAIAEGWDATRTELEVLRAGRPRAPLPGAGATQGAPMGFAFSGPGAVIRICSKPRASSRRA